MNRRGFSLIEVVIAIGIFAFAAITIMTLLSRGLQSSRESRLDNASAILSGRIVSLLKASYAWTNSSANPEMADFVGNRDLKKIAAGPGEIHTNYYLLDLQRTTDTNAAEFQVVTDIRPLNDGLLATTSTNLQDAIGRFSNSKNAVFASVAVSFPVRSPENLRSKRDFATIITMRSDE